MRKRSTYRPREVNANAHQWVVSGLKPVSMAHGPITTLRLQNHMALECIRTGTADAQDIEVLVAASNMAIALMCLGHGNDWKAELDAGADALLEIARRGAKSGSFTPRGANAGRSIRR